MHHKRNLRTMWRASCHPLQYLCVLGAVTGCVLALACRVDLQLPASRASAMLRGACMSPLHASEPSFWTCSRNSPIRDLNVEQVPILFRTLPPVSLWTAFFWWPPPVQLAKHHLLSQAIVAHPDCHYIQHTVNRRPRTALRLTHKATDGSKPAPSAHHCNISAGGDVGCGERHTGFAKGPRRPLVQQHLKRLCLRPLDFEVEWGVRWSHSCLRSLPKDRNAKPTRCPSS